MSLRIAAVGDLVLDEPDPAFFLAPSAELLRTAEVTIGHVEVPHTTSTEQATLDIPAPPSAPAALADIANAGFDVVTLAGNHVYDCGPQGVMDTVRYARAAGLRTTGAGAGIEEAATPAIVESQGMRVGVLSFNCVGPRESWASSAKPGGAYVNVLTHYELDSASPGGPPSVYSFATPESLSQMQGHVRRLKAQVDVVVVALHKGIGHTPAALADYEVPLAHAAVDAGADLVVGHHAHIMRGIELYRGVPIFHGLGNFATVTTALSHDEDSPERRAWAKRREELFGFRPDPAMPTYPFHPESRNSAIAWCSFGPEGLIEAGFVPVWIDDDARPIPLGDGEQGRRVTDYIVDISRRAGFETDVVWSGDRVVLREGPEEEQP